MDQILPDASRPTASGPQEKYDNLVIDGGGLAVTAWTTHRHLERPEDRVQSAVYVFMTTLASCSSLVKTNARIVVCWDGRDNRRFRRGRHPWYKHGRGSVVNRVEIREVVSQLDELMDCMGVYQASLDGHEADDVAATIAQKIADVEERVLVFSDDKDYLQLVDDYIHVMRRQLEGVIHTPESAEMMGVEVGEKYLFIKAMAGDPGDNIKGLRGIGEAKAVSLLELNPSIVDQMDEDPSSVDWSMVDGSLRAAFVRAGRRFLAPMDYDKAGVTFAKKFAKEHDIKYHDFEMPESISLAYAAAEVKWCLDLVRMDREIPYKLEHPRRNVAKIPAVLRRLGLSRYTDIYQPLTMLAGVTMPNAELPWRSGVRAGDSVKQEERQPEPSMEDMF